MFSVRWVFSSFASKFTGCLFHQKRHIRNPLLLMLIMFKILYILFWTWILDLICKSGHKGIAWALVLAPYVLVLLAIILKNSE